MGNWDELPPDIANDTAWDSTPPDEDQSESLEAQKAAEDVNFAVNHPIVTSFGGKAAIDLAEKAGNAYDVYSGSRATRKGVGEGIDQLDSAEGFGPAGFLKTMGSSIAKNYGKDIQAPTGKDLVLKTDVGKSLPPWAQSAAGVVAEGVLDPTLALPAGAFTRTAKTAVEGAEIGARAVAKGAKTAGNVAVKAADVLIPGASGMIKIPAKKAGSIVNSLVSYVRPEVREEFINSVKVATKNGIDPELLPAAVKYRGGTQSTISKMERVRAQGVTGEPHFLKHQQGLNQVRGAYDKKVTGYTGGGRPLNPTEAGETLRNEYNGVVDQFFKDNDLGYDTAWKQAPDLEFTDPAKISVQGVIENSRSKAMQMVERGATPEIKAQGQRLLKIIDNAENVVMNGNYKQSAEVMRELGGVGFKRIQGVLPENAAIHRDLYRAISEGAVKTGREKLGADFAEELAARNKGFTEFFNKQKQLGLNLNDANIPGENVFRAAVESGNSQTIRAMKDILKNRPEALNQLKATYLENLKVVDKDGGFSLSALRRAFDNDSRAAVVMRELFTPEEFKDLYDLAKLGDDFGPPILNTSGTDVSRGIRDIFRSVPEAISQDWVIDAMKQGAKVPPSVGGAGLPSGLLPKPRAPLGSSTQKFVSEAVSDPQQALRQYFTALKPTRRQVIGKVTQEYALTKQDDRQSAVKSFDRQAVLSRVQGTPWEQQLGNVKNDNDFALRYFALQQSSPEFRAAVKGQTQ